MKNLEEKLDQIDEKLDKYNLLLEEHIKRTNLLEDKQDNYEKTLLETKQALEEFKPVIKEIEFFKQAYTKFGKLIWWLILLVLVIVFKNDSTVVEFVKAILGAGG